MVDIVPVHVESVPEVDPATEEKCSQWFRQAADIVFEKKTTPGSKVVTLLKRLTHKTRVLEKDDIRDELKLELSTALEAGGMPPGLIQPLTKVFVLMSVNDIELVYTQREDSIALYLRCLSLGSLWRLRYMIESGLLLRFLREVIRQIAQSRHRVQMLVRAADFNTCLYCLNSAAGEPELFFSDVTLLNYRYTL